MSLHLALLAVGSHVVEVLLAALVVLLHVLPTARTWAEIAVRLGTLLVVLHSLRGAGDSVDALRHGLRAAAKGHCEHGAYHEFFHNHSFLLGLNK